MYAAHFKRAQMFNFNYYHLTNSKSRFICTKSGEVSVCGFVVAYSHTHNKCIQCCMNSLEQSIYNSRPMCNTLTMLRSRCTFRSLLLSVYIFYIRFMSIYIHKYGFIYQTVWMNVFLFFIDSFMDYLSLCFQCNPFIRIDIYIIFTLRF